METYKKGISLIVLVITILVLAILATAVILILSNTNIIEETTNTTFKSDMASFKDAYNVYLASKLSEDKTFNQSTLNVTSSDDEFNKIFGDNVKDEYKAGLKVIDGILVYETENEKELEIVKELGMVKIEEEITPVEIPDGFTMSIYQGEMTIEEGLVIYKTDKATLSTYSQEDAQKAFDQFVWVPVEYTKTNTDTDANGTDDGFDAVFTRTEWSENAPTGTIATKYTEPSSYNGSTAYQYAEEVAEYDAMRKSVEKYGGFYIGRYEAGDGDVTAARTTYTTGAHTVVLRKQAYIYNYVGWGNDMTDVTSDIVYNNTNRGKGAVYLSSNMYGTNASYTTHLIYSVQWDAALRWLSDQYDVTASSSWGNYSDSTGDAATNSGSSNMNYTTGRNDAWKAKNIYDLAGNVYEWTMEAYSSNYRVSRGGNFYNSGSGNSASERGNSFPYSANNSLIGFRPVLYINL